MIGRWFPGLVAVSLLSTLGASAAQPACGGAYVTTLPSDADVFFDGTYVGRSPLVVDGVSPGRHGLTITRAGFASLETTVVVEAGTIVPSSTRLGDKARGEAPVERGTLVVRDVPEHATTRVDGTAFEPAKRPLALPVGTHELVVETRLGRMTRPFSIYAGLATNVVLAETHVDEHRSGVVAPAEDYLPTDAFVVRGSRIVVRYLGHTIVAHFGDPKVRLDGATVVFDSAPESIAGKLYLPLSLLEKVTGDVSKSR